MAITITKPAVNISERLSNLDGISLENFKAMDATFSSVGIGTANPQRLLHLSSTSNIGIRMEGPQPRLEFGETDSTDQNYAIRLNGGDLIFDTRDDEFSIIGETMRLKNSGYVGIGTTSPATILDCRENSTGASTQIRVYNTDNSDTTTQTAALFLAPDSRANGALIYAEKENADFSTNAGRDVSLVFSPVLNNSQTEAMRIDSAGNVGIGTIAPNKLGWDANARVLTHFGIRRSVIELGSDTPVNNDVLGQLSFMSAGTTKASIRTVLDGSSNGSIVFDTEGTEALRITDNGNIVFPAGHGIDFNASQSGAAGTTPSSTATLNDYEEGTWTVGIIGNLGGTASIGTRNQESYTKVGNLVTATFYVSNINVTGLTGQVTITGLPFTSTGYHVVIGHYCDLFSFDEETLHVGGYTEAGQAVAYLTKGSSPNAINASDATATAGSMMCTIVYLT